MIELTEGRPVEDDGARVLAVECDGDVFAVHHGDLAKVRIREIEVLVEGRELEAVASGELAGSFLGRRSPHASGESHS